jgi:hypothetical protein
MKALLRFGSLVLATLFVVGCGDSAAEPDADPGLAGSYQLLALTQAGQTGSPPFVVGTMTLTSTRYDLDIEVLVPGQEQQVADRGTYSAQNSVWRQTSDTMEGEGVGTYTMVGTTLTLDMEVPELGHLVMVWAVVAN